MERILRGNFGMSKAVRVKKEMKRNEGTDDKEDMITTVELNEVLKHAKKRKSCVD